MAFQCGKCGKTFSRKDSLNRHLSSTNCSMCNVCGKNSFPDSRTFIEHTKICNTRCFNCNKECKDVKRHLRKTGCSQRPKYKCTICSQSFVYPKKLNRHVLEKHKANERYRCEYCDIKHNSARSLFLHKNRFHSNADPETETDVDNDVEEKQQLVGGNSDGESDIPGPSWVGDHDDCTCWHCGERFANRDALRDHNHNDHQVTNADSSNRSAKPRPHKCPYEGCSRSFIRRSTLLVHIARRHESDQNDDTNIDMDTGSDGEDSSGDDDDDFLPPTSKLFKTIGEPTKRVYKKFNAEEMEMTYMLKRKAIELSAMGFSYEVIQKVLKAIFREYADRDGYLQVFLDSWTLDFPIKTRAERASEQYINSLMHQIESVLGSKDSFLFDAPVTIKITFIPSNQLSIGVRLQFPQCENNEEFSSRSKFCWCPISLDSNDFRCLGACLVAFFRIRNADLAGKSYKSKQWYRDKGASLEFQREVDKIYRQVGVESDRFQDEAALDKFQEYLNNKRRNERYQMVVYESPNVKNVVYSGTPRRTHKRRIHLSVWNNHCYLILNIRGYLKKEICAECGKFYTVGKIHNCSKRCSDCEKYACVLRQQLSKGHDRPEYCRLCDRFFRSNSCWSWHRFTTCPVMKRCSACLMVVQRVGKYSPLLVKHNCNKNQFYTCSNCKERLPRDSPDRHFCTIREPEAQTLIAPPKYYIICYDFETYTDTNTKELKPYLVACVVHCEKCSKFAEGGWDEECDVCGKKERYWWGKEWEKFCRFLLFDPNRRIGVKVYAWAHNSKRFDHVFILQYLIKNGHTPPLRFKGTQVAALNYNNVEFKDFYSFFPQKLADAPKAFGFEHRVRKGYFPHFFVRSEYVRNPPILPQLPDEKYYGTDAMKNEKDLTKFREWYNQHKNDDFDFKNEAIAYCLDDVRVLARAVQAYRSMSLKISCSKVDGLMSKATSLAGFSALLYRACFMPANSIGLIPRIGYDTPRRQSAFAMKALDYLNECRSLENLPLIHHKGNYGEQKIGTMYVDGYEPLSKTAYEIHGCWMHACPTCYKSDFDSKGVFGCDRIHPWHKISYNAVLEKTRKKEWRLKNHPSVSNLQVFWECQIKKEVSTKPLFEVYWRGRAHLKPHWHSFDLRDCLYGGLCEVFGLSRKLTNQEIDNGYRIMYYDVVSMYPFVQFAMQWPGDLHPRIYDPKELIGKGRNWTAQTLKNYSPCILSCFLEPPTDELYPNIPARIKGFTMFVLCYTCAMENYQDVCPHKDPRDRGLFGCYTSVDLEYALRYGWKIVQVFQLHSWNRNPTRNDTFRSFIRELIKIKVESSGWPDDRQTQGEKEAFLQDWKQKHGIQLDRENISHNPGMRTLAKLLLNSNWGKMAEKASNCRVEYVKDWSHLKCILFDKSCRVEEFQLTPDGKVGMVTYKTFKEDCADSGFLNIMIAAFVTSYARRRLFEIIHQAPGRVLYCDTDSIVWLHVIDRFLLPQPIGETLGDLKSETAVGEFIRCFLALGPKNYRLEFATEDNPYQTTRVEWKAKGIIQTIVARNSLDGRVYEALIERRLDELDSFYQRYRSADPQVRMEAVQQCERMARVQKEVEERCGLKHPPGIFVNHPTLKRKHNRMTGAMSLFAEHDSIKIIKMTANKRVYIPSVAAAGMNSVPFGFKLISSREDELWELVWDDNLKDFCLVE